MPAEDGSNENNEIFGSIVNRRIDVGSDNNDNGTSRKQSESQFQHETAIFVRYVDPSITTERMLDIVKMNPSLNEALEKDPSSIEITRLVKKTLTEDQIALFKNGVSFRIGCTNLLFETLKTKSNWATHWQIRPWDSDYRSTEAGNGASKGDLNWEPRNTTQINRK